MHMARPLLWSFSTLVTNPGHRIKEGYPASNFQDSGYIGGMALWIEVPELGVGTHYRGRQPDVLKLRAREGLAQRGKKKKKKPPVLDVFSGAVLRYQTSPELCYPEHIWVL